MKLLVSNVRTVIPRRADEARRVMLVMVSADVSGNRGELNRGDESANIKVNSPEVGQELDDR